MFLVFVYGSLRTDESNHVQMAGARLVSAHSVARDVALIPYLEGFPGLIRAPGSRARGEVFEVDAEHLARLDLFEGVPSEYLREPVECEGLGRVFAYLAARPAGFDRVDKEEWPRSKDNRPGPSWTR
jgi:gamma-glutamylcyclotransferase (GGCT)/AIG2-like uncharacterized protein YtfP